MESSQGDGVGQQIEGAGGGGEGGSKDKGKSKEEVAMGGHGGGGLGERVQDLDDKKISVHPASSSIRPPKYYDRVLVRRYINGSNWTLLEEYLILVVLRDYVDAGLKFAPIVLCIRRAELSDIVAAKELDKAIDYFKENVQPLAQCTGPCVNGQAMKTEVDVIAEQINNGKVTISDDMERDINDYFMLYLPHIAGYPEKPARAISKLWQFATRTYSEDKEDGKSSRPNYRCLACGREFMVAISVLRSHFLGGHQCAQCLKLTDNIRGRLQLIFPEAEILQGALEQPQVEMEGPEHAPEPQVEVERHQDSLLEKNIKDARERVHSAFLQEINTHEDRIESNRQLLDAYNILGRCLVMAANKAYEAVPSLNIGGAGPSSLAALHQLDQGTKVSSYISVPRFDEALNGCQRGYNVENQWYGTNPPQSLYPGYQILPDQRHAEQSFNQALSDPQHYGSWSLLNTTQAGYIEFDPSKTSYPAYLPDQLHGQQGFNQTPSDHQNYGSWSLLNTTQAGESVFTDASQSSYPADQMPQNVCLPDQLHGQQGFNQTPSDPQNYGSWSLLDTTQAGESVFTYASQSSYPAYQMTQNVLDGQLPPTADIQDQGSLGQSFSYPQQPPSGFYCQHGFSTIMDCHICTGFY